MKIKEFETLVEQKVIKNGCFTSIKWQSDVDLKASFKGVYDAKKVSEGVARLGVNYGHIAQVKERGKEPQSLPYGSWHEGKENLIIDHNGGYQLRMAKTGNNKQKPKTIYLLDGKEISKEQLVEMGIAVPSYWNKGGIESPVFNVKLENVMRIGRP